jgi:ATP-dependent RNA helicase DHX57
MLLDNRSSSSSSSSPSPFPSGLPSSGNSSGRSSSSGALQGVTHLIVDEVHERTIDVDLILMALRHALMNTDGAGGGGGGGGDGAEVVVPKIILMSATLDAVELGSYFSSVSVNTVAVPGRTFPVETFYLEDAVLHSGYVCREGDLYARDKPLAPTSVQTPRASAISAAADAAAAAEKAAEQGSGVSSTQAKNLAEEAARSSRVVASFGKGPVGNVGTEWLASLGEKGLVERLSAKKGATTKPPAAAAAAANSSPATTLRAMGLGSINNALVAALLLHHHDQNGGGNGGNGGGSGAALVFCPGVFELRAAEEALLRAGRGKPSFWVVSLHSMASTEESKKAFATGSQIPKGLTKVVLATDIAETSLTIPDVTLVIDSGLSRTTVADPKTGAPHLCTSRVSAAAAAQRRGRAGRVQVSCSYYFLG